MPNRFVTRLSFRQALNTVVLAILLGIGATAVEHIYYVEREREAIESQTRQVLGLVTAAAAKAAYVLDTELASEVLTGLLSYSPIYEARLNDEMGNQLAYRSSPRVESRSRWFSELLFGQEVHISVPLFFTVPNRRLGSSQIGTLSVSVDTHSIAIRFLDRAGTSVVSSLVGNLLLGFLLLLLFHRMVTRPLMMIARDLVKVRPQELSSYRLAVPAGQSGTEIGFLVERTNELLGRYEATLQQRDVFMDDLIAARQRAEEANRAKSQFLTTISHELRTPLNAIIGFSQILRDDLSRSEHNTIYSDFAAEIYNSGQHLLTVINDIIDFSNIETGRLDTHPEAVEVRTVFESCTRLIVPRMEAAGLTFLSEIASDTPPLFADPRGTKQILMHLLSNALKFTVVGGTITLTARAHPNGVELAVSDTGIGIAKNDLPNIFQPFWQAAPVLSRQHEGTGLGLTVVKSLVELNRGSIEVESAPTQGTTFIIVLPAYTPRAVQTAVDSAEASAVGSDEHMVSSAAD